MICHVVKVCSCRYEIHQLIQAFVKKVSQGRCSQALIQGEKMACAHFISRLADNANMYWSKDKCKGSADAFNEYRHNFEHFLHVYVHAMEKQDMDCQLSSTSKFLDNFPQKCMYLERCLLPSFYIKILEKLLNHFETESQPVHTVELLCLLGNEKRRMGNQAQYKDLMNKAKQVYARNYTEFRTNGLSQVHFFNSYARYLFERKLPWKLVNNVDEIALILCRKKLKEHPERAATLLFVGRQRKSMLHLLKAMDLFKSCLGEHFMTTQCHKAIADFYFVRGRTEAEVNRSFEHFEEALNGMEELGMAGHKQCILTLKNYGLCHKFKGHFLKAINFLEKAKRVADIELEDDHKWKVMIETELALLHDYVGRVEEAKLFMRKGIEMCNRLEQPIDKLANRFEIKLFLSSYQDTLN